MSRIFCIVGKSCSGKDTLYRAILEEKRPGLIPVVPCTTRPRRSHEIDGLNYRFVDDRQMEAFARDGKIIELRQYRTTQGLWSYFTLQFPLKEGEDYLLITTLEGVRALAEHYGPELVQVLYLYVEDRQRLLRCINREALQSRPDYSEVCRRFLADQRDFSPEQLSQVQNLHQIDTQAPLEVCLKQWRAVYEGRS